MDINYGNGTSDVGPGICIRLSKEDVERAIQDYLDLKDVKIQGDYSIAVSGVRVTGAEINVDAFGVVEHEGREYSGRGSDPEAVPRDVRWNF